jgi:hypothetical protein
VIRMANKEDKQEQGGTISGAEICSPEYCYI